jgi:hypothetical protein
MLFGGKLFVCSHYLSRLEANTNKERNMPDGLQQDPVNRWNLFAHAKFLFFNQQRF